jgi:hypothetical protein
MFTLESYPRYEVMTSAGMEVCRRDYFHYDSMICDACSDLETDVMGIFMMVKLWMAGKQCTRELNPSLPTLLLNF